MKIFKTLTMAAAMVAIAGLTSCNDDIDQSFVSVVDPQLTNPVEFVLAKTAEGGPIHKIVDGQVGATISGLNFDRMVVDDGKAIFAYTLQTDAEKAAWQRYEASEGATLTPMIAFTISQKGDRYSLLGNIDAFFTRLNDTGAILFKTDLSSVDYTNGKAQCTYVQSEYTYLKAPYNFMLRTAIVFDSVDELNTFLDNWTPVAN